MRDSAVPRQANFPEWLSIERPVRQEQPPEGPRKSLSTLHLKGAEHTAYPSNLPTEIFPLSHSETERIKETLLPPHVPELHLQMKLRVYQQGGVRHGVGNTAGWCSRAKEDKVMLGCMAVATFGLLSLGGHLHLHGNKWKPLSTHLVFSKSILTLVPHSVTKTLVLGCCSSNLWSRQIVWTKMSLGS